MSAAELPALLESVRARGKASVETALAMLDLYAVSDAEQKRSLVDLACRGLPHRDVVGRFVELAAAEADSDLRERLVARLFWIDPREVPDLPAYVRVCAGLLEHEEVRGRAAGCLQRLVAGGGEIADAAVAALIGACRATISRDQQRRLLIALCTLEVLPPAVRDLFVDLLDRVDEDAKAALVSRLLASGALDADRLAKLLVPTEPLALKLLALDHAVDRALDLDEAFAEVLRSDPEPACRGAAARALAARGGTSRIAAEALLHALRADPHAGVRQAAALAFDHSLSRTPEALSALSAALSTERTEAGLELLLDLVAPFTARSPAVRDAMLSLLRGNLKADLVALVYGVLGKLAAADGALADQLIDALATEEDQRVRAAILESLSALPDPDGKHLRLWLAALQSSDPKLRGHGVAGLLRAPLTTAQADQLSPAVLVLSDPKLDRWSRRTLAQKLSRLCGASRSAALGAAFKEAAGKVDDEEVRAVCEEAADRAAAGAKAIDWDLWFHRVEVDHRTDGLFPDLFVHFDENPAAARRILRACLNPPASETLYPTYRGQLNAEVILGQLVRRNLVDDDLSRYAVAKLLDPRNHGGDRFYLGLLKSNPRFPSLAKDAWRLLEVRKDAPPVLLRELLVLAHGGDEAAGAELQRRIAAVQTPAQAAPFLRFLFGNAAWPPARAAFSSLKADSKPFAAPEHKKALEELAEAMNLPLPSPPKPPDEDGKSDQGPGLADD